MADNNVKKTISKRNAGTHDHPVTQEQDNRDIFDKALDSPAAPYLGMIAGGVVGGLAGKGYAKSKRLVGRKVSGDEGFIGSYGGMAGGLGAGAAARYSHAGSNGNQKARK